MWNDCLDLNDSFIQKKLQINRELKRIFYEFEYVYGCFCCLSGGLIVGKDEDFINDIFEKKNDIDCEKDEDFDWEKEKEWRVKNEYKKLKKSQEYILNFLNKLSSLFYVWITNKKIQDLLVNIDDFRFSEKYSIHNGLFSPSCIVTINNCINLLSDVFVKNKKIFLGKIKNIENSQIIEKTFGKEYLPEINEKIPSEKLIFQIYKDQKNVEQIILLLRHIYSLQCKDLLIWLKSTIQYNKKS